MKKLFLVLLAVLLAFSMAVIGCGGGSSSNDDDDDDPNNPGGDGKKKWSSGDLAADGNFVHKVPLNFVYNDDLDVPGQSWKGGPDVSQPEGYQLGLDSAKLLGGHKITEGDEIKLTIKFTLSRVADNVDFSFVDDSSAAGYWRPLTKSAVIGKKGEDFEDDKAFMEEVIAAGLNATDTYEYEIEYTAIATATTAARDRNKFYIYFDAEHAATYATIALANAADSDNVTITFTKFMIDVNGGSETSGGVEEEPEYTIAYTAANALPVIFDNGKWAKELEGLTLVFDTLSWTGKDGATLIDVKWEGKDTDCDATTKNGEGKFQCGETTCTAAHKYDAAGQIIINFKTPVDFTPYKNLIVEFVDLDDVDGYLGIMLLPGWNGNWAGPGADDLIEDISDVDSDVPGFVISNFDGNFAIKKIYFEAK